MIMLLEYFFKTIINGIMNSYLEILNKEVSLGDKDNSQPHLFHPTGVQGKFSILSYV